jgi:hypothetical protein
VRLGDARHTQKVRSFLRTLLFRPGVAPKIQPPPMAVYKSSVSAPTVAHETSSGRHERNRSDVRKPHGRPRSGRLFETSPGVRAQLRNQKVADPSRSVPRVLSDSAPDNRTLSLVSGQTAALGKVPFESGMGTALGKLVIRSRCSGA